MLNDEGCGSCIEIRNHLELYSAISESLARCAEKSFTSAIIGTYSKALTISTAREKMYPVNHKIAKVPDLHNSKVLTPTAHVSKGQVRSRPSPPGCPPSRSCIFAKQARWNMCLQEKMRIAPVPSSPLLLLLSVDDAMSMVPSFLLTPLPLPLSSLDGGLEGLSSEFGWRFISLSWLLLCQASQM